MCRAVVQKYLLEKSRICSQGRTERNYHVFYYLLAGASDIEKKALHLKRAEDYNYLSRVSIFSPFVGHSNFLCSSIIIVVYNF